MTSKVIYGDEVRMLPWALEKIGLAAFRPDARAIGMEKDGELVAVVVFDNFSDVDCHMHIASDGTRRWMNRELLVRTFAYPFIQLGLARVTGMVEEGNDAALRFDEHLGFQREGYHPQAGSDGRAMISLGLLRESCRFVPDQFKHPRN